MYFPAGSARARLYRTRLSVQILERVRHRCRSTKMHQRKYFFRTLPYADDNRSPMASIGAIKYVATVDRIRVDKFSGPTGDAVEAVRQLKAQKGPEIQIYGSSSFFRLNRGRLIDEYLIRLPLSLAAAIACSKKGHRREREACGYEQSSMASSQPLFAGCPLSPARSVSTVEGELARRRRLGPRKQNSNVRGGNEISPTGPPRLR